MAGLSAFLDQKPPLEHDVFGDLENPTIEHRPHFVREPIIQSARRLGSSTSSMPKRISARVTALT
jgi:hypothetical protein